MIFNLVLVLIIFLIYFLTRFGNNKHTNDKLFLIIVFVIFTILVGFRKYNMGNDTISYLNYFQKCYLYKWKILQLNQYYDKGFSIFNIIISYLTHSSRLYLVIVSIIFNSVIFRYIKNNSKNYLISVLMYVMLLFFYSSMTMFRQFFAMIIVIYSLKFVKERKIIYFVLSLLFASFFHSTSWICLPLYYIYNKDYSNKVAIIIGIVSFFCMFYIDDVIVLLSNLIGKTNYYNSRIGSNSISNTIYFLIYFIMFIFCLLLSKNDKIKCKEISFYLYVFLLASSINLVGTNMNILARAADYYSLITICAFPNVIFSYVRKNNNSFIFYSVFIFLLILYSSIIIYYKPEWNSAFRYESCLFSSDEKNC